MKKKESKSEPYHHGDLRNALIAASLTVLATEGSDALTLRKVARRAGVSHAAPYRHFADKDALLAAIAGEGFQRLAQTVETAVAAATGDSLIACGMAYVRFGLENPDHLRVMFSGGVRDMGVYPDLLEEALNALGLLTRCIVSEQRAARVAAGDPTRLMLAMWAMLHGVTTLIIEQKIPNMDCTDTTAMLPFAEQMILTFIRGLAAGEPER